MKKILFILLIIPTLLFAQTEVSVMGVPLSLPAKQFVKEWAAKNNYELTADNIEWLNHTFVSAEEAELYDFSAYITFAGIDSCLFAVNSKMDGSIDKVFIDKAYTNREDMLPLKALYDSKYGTPSYEKLDYIYNKYVYIVGSTMIEFTLIYESNYRPELPSEFVVKYWPNKFGQHSNDEI